jgi:hypothetical protein
MKTVWKRLGALLALALLAGCQPTPELPVVIQKDMEQMIEKAQESDGHFVTPTAMEGPPTYQTELISAKGNVIVRVDADVVIPTVDAVPTARVDKQAFSQETADKLMALLLKGHTLYELEGYLQRTKAEIQERLVQLYAMQAGTIPADVDGSVEENIETAERQLASAPEERIRIPAQTTFHKRDMGDMPGEPYDYIEGVAEMDGVPAYFAVENRMDRNEINATFYRDMNARRYYMSLSELEGKIQVDESQLDTGIDAAAAQAQADALVEALGQGDIMVCADVEPSVSFGAEPAMPEGSMSMEGVHAAYIVRYVRVLNGVPITYTGKTGTHLESEENYAPPWQYEAITMIIDGTGILEFNWNSPYTEPEIVTANTSLLPFDHISSVFEKMVLVQYAWYEEGAMELDIDSVQLGLMRVTNTERRDSGLLIPVWDFFGSMTAVPDDGDPYLWGANDSLLTINAIDGSVIDRGLGY